MGGAPQKNSSNAVQCFGADSLTKCVKCLQIRNSSFGPESVVVEVMLLEAAVHEATVHVSHSSSAWKAVDMQQKV